MHFTLDLKEFSFMLSLSKDNSLVQDKHTPRSHFMFLLVKDKHTLGLHFVIFLVQDKHTSCSHFFIYLYQDKHTCCRHFEFFKSIIFFKSKVKKSLSKTDKDNSFFKITFKSFMWLPFSN